MVKLTAKQTAIATAIAAVGVSAYVRPFETAVAIGTPVAIAATYGASKAIYGAYNYFHPKEPKKVEPSVAQKTELRLKEDLKSKETALDNKVTEMDKALITAIKSSKNPAALLADYANVTKMEREWLDKFREEGVNDTAMLTKVTSTYTTIMKAIMPEEEMRKFGEKSVDMLLLAMECNELREKLYGPVQTKAGGQTFTKAVQQVNSSLVNPVIDSSVDKGGATKHATKVLQQAVTASSIVGVFKG